MAYNFSAFKEKIKSVEEWLGRELSGVRTSRATPTILDGVTVESYGTKMPISQVASVTSEGAQNLRVSPWDISLVKNIEKAITDADLGLSVSADEKGVRVIFPALTSERRASLLKIVGQKLEDAKVSLRGEREKVWEDIQEKEKAGGMGEDEKFRLKTEMQKMVDEAQKKIEESAKRKEKEITS